MISTALSIRGSEVPAGLLDTSVVIDWDDGAVAAALPDEVSVCAVTVAELAANPHLAPSGAERASRQARLQQVEAMFEPFAVRYGSSPQLRADRGCSRGGRPLATQSCR